MKKSLILLITIFLLSCTPTKETTIKENMTGSLAEKNTEELKAKNTLEIDSEEFEELKEVWGELNYGEKEETLEKKEVIQRNIDNIFGNEFSVSIVEEYGIRGEKIENNNFIFSYNIQNPLIKEILNDNILTKIEAECIFKIMSLRLSAIEEIYPERMCVLCRSYISSTPLENIQKYKLQSIKNRYIELENMKSDNLVSSEEYQNLLNQIAEDIYITAILNILYETDNMHTSIYDFDICKRKNGVEKEDIVKYEKFSEPNPENYKVDEQCLKNVLEKAKEDLGDSQTIQKIETLMSEKEHFIKLINTLNE